MSEQKVPHHAAFYKLLSTAAGIAVTVIGCLVLIGWIFNLPFLQNVLPGLPKMVANTAVAFVLAGASLWLYSQASKPVTGSGLQRRMAQVLAFLVTLIGLLTLSEYLFKWDLGLDQLLLEDPAGALVTSFPGRPSPHTALAFVLVGLALFVLNIDIPSRHSLAQFCTLLAAFIASVALVGYSLSISVFYSLSLYTGMALHTAVSFVVLCAGLLFLHPDQGFMLLMTGNSPGGIMARRLLLAAISVPWLVGWVSILGARAGLYNTGFETEFFVVMSIYAFSMAVWGYAHSLNRIDTARKQLEQALRNSEHLLLEAQRIAHLGSWEMDIASGNSIWSDEFYRICGYEPGTIEASVETQSQIIHPDDREAAAAAVQQAIEEVKPYSIQKRIVRPNGEIRLVLSQGEVITDEHGDVLKVVGTFLDITERKQAEAEVEQRNRQLAILYSIAQATAESMELEKLLDRAIEATLEAFQVEMGGILLLEADGETLKLRAHRGLSKELQQNFQILKVGEGVFGQAVVAQQPTVLNIADYPTKRLAPFIVQAGLQTLVSTPLLSAGKPIGVLSLATRRDRRFLAKEINLLATIGRQVGTAVENARLYAAVQQELIERKRTEEALAQNVAELARSNEELELFAYVASHDLQEPLRMVSSYVQLLEKRYRGQLDDKADKYIGYAVDGASRMKILINDLLAFSRVGTQGKELTPTESEVVLEQVLTRLQLAIKENEARVTYDSLPTVLADEIQLGQLFQNLIGNALKFRNEAAPHIHISATQLANNDEQLTNSPIPKLPTSQAPKLSPTGWLFSVQDNGIGLDPQFAERIFIIFQRLHGKTEYSGTGIGLAICKKIVGRHGGRIWVESKTGQGATFYFTLPGPMPDAETITTMETGPIETESANESEEDTIAKRARELI